MVPIKSTHTIGWNILNGWLVEELEGWNWYIASNKNSIPGRILLLKVNVYTLLVI
jgi:hypothetical protein